MFIFYFSREQALNYYLKRKTYKLNDKNNEGQTVLYIIKTIDVLAPVPL